MPPEAPAVQQTSADDTQSVAALEGAFEKAIDGGARGRDPVTQRFTSPKPKAAAEAPGNTDSAAAAPGDGAAPSEGTPSGEAPETPQTKAGPSEETPIEPPASWSRDKADTFRSLPRDAQEIIAQRERERDVELRRGQNESAEHRKAVEAERDALKQERQSLAQQASLYVSVLEKEFVANYADVTSLAKLSDEDPARYIKMMGHLEDIRLKKQEEQGLRGQIAQQAERELQKFRADEDQAFREEQGLHDDAKWTAHQTEMKAFAKKAGISEDELAGASRAHLSIMADAMKYRASVAAMEKAKAAGDGGQSAPRVQQPGTVRRAGKDEQGAALMKSLRETHSTEAAEAAIAHALLRGGRNDSNKRNVR